MDVIKNILITLGIFFVILLIIAGTLAGIEDRKECEQAGGFFYSGFFSADNCVFPPKGDK